MFAESRGPSSRLEPARVFGGQAGLNSLVLAVLHFAGLLPLDQHTLPVYSVIVMPGWALRGVHYAGVQLGRERRWQPFHYKLKTCGSGQRDQASTLKGCHMKFHKASHLRAAFAT